MSKLYVLALVKNVTIFFFCNYGSESRVLFENSLQVRGTVCWHVAKEGKLGSVFCTGNQRVASETGFQKSLGTT